MLFDDGCLFFDNIILIIIIMYIIRILDIIYGNIFLIYVSNIVLSLNIYIVSAIRDITNIILIFVLYLFDFICILFDIVYINIVIYIYVPIIH